MEYNISVLSGSTKKSKPVVPCGLCGDDVEDTRCIECETVKFKANLGSMESFCDHSKEHNCLHTTNASVHQTLDELDFDRGIWNAALYGDSAEVESKLAQNKCDVNSCDKSGYTALHYASRNGHLDICKILLDNGANVNAATASTKSTPLHRAAYMGHVEIVSLLLAHGADVTATDCDGKTPLDKAKEKGNDTTSDLLIKALASK